MVKQQWNVQVVIPMAVVMGFTLICFCFFQLSYPYHFFFKGQNQLFLMSWSYVTTLFAKPAWMACLAGEFLTQFYYYDYAGAMILTMVLTLLLVLVYISVYRLLPKRWLALAVAVGMVEPLVQLMAA